MANSERDPRSNDSWRARRNFVSCQVSNARFPSAKFQKFDHNTSIGVAMKTFGTVF